MGKKKEEVDKSESNKIKTRNRYNGYYEMTVVVNLNSTLIQ